MMDGPKGVRAAGGEQSPLMAERGRAEEEANPVRIVDDLRVIRVAHSPEVVHRSHGGLILRARVVDNPLRPTRPVSAAAPRAAAATGAVAVRPPSPAPMVIPHPGWVARANAGPHRSVPAQGVGKGQKPNRRSRNRRGAGAPPVWRRLRIVTRRAHRASQRQAPVLPGLNRTQAEGPAATLVAADAKR